MLMCEQKDISLIHPPSCFLVYLFFFFNDTATTEIYTLSLHDALPICHHAPHPDLARAAGRSGQAHRRVPARRPLGDRKSTRLNSSHLVISYAVFCLKKKNSSSSVRQPASSPPECR